MCCSPVDQSLVVSFPLLVWGAVLLLEGSPWLAACRERHTDPGSFLQLHVLARWFQLKVISTARVCLALMPSLSTSCPVFGVQGFGEIVLGTL